MDSLVWAHRASLDYPRLADPPETIAVGRFGFCAFAIAFSPKQNAAGIPVVRQIDGLERLQRALQFRWAIQLLGRGERTCDTRSQGAIIG
jgi:hypothetical protein